MQTVRCATAQVAEAQQQFVELQRSLQRQLLALQRELDLEREKRKRAEVEGGLAWQCVHESDNAAAVARRREHTLKAGVRRALRVQHLRWQKASQAALAQQAEEYDKALKEGRRKHQAQTHSPIVAIRGGEQNGGARSSSRARAGSTGGGNATGITLCSLTPSRCG